MGTDRGGKLFFIVKRYRTFLLILDTLISVQLIKGIIRMCTSLFYVSTICFHMTKFQFLGFVPYKKTVFLVILEWRIIGCRADKRFYDVPDIAYLFAKYRFFCLLISKIQTYRFDKKKERLNLCK